MSEQVVPKSSVPASTATFGWARDGPIRRSGGVLQFALLDLQDVLRRALGDPALELGRRQADGRHIDGGGRNWFFPHATAFASRRRSATTVSRSVSSCTIARSGCVRSFSRPSVLRRGTRSRTSARSTSGACRGAKPGPARCDPRPDHPGETRRHLPRRPGRRPFLAVSSAGGTDRPKHPRVHATRCPGQGLRRH